MANNAYASEDGTSLAAPIVSGVAAVVRPRYPKLAVSQVKEIILEYGNIYNFKVRYPGMVNGPRVPFSELSKSSKVVNLYNALLVAEEIAKQ